MTNMIQLGTVPNCTFLRWCLFCTAHQQFSVSYSFDWGHFIGQGCKLTGLSHDGAYVQAGSLIYVVLRWWEYQTLMLDLDVWDTCAYIGSLLVIYYKYGASHNVVALPFLFSQVLLNQETYGLWAVGKAVILYEWVQWLQKFIFKWYSESFKCHDNSLLIQSKVIHFGKLFSENIIKSFPKVERNIWRRTCWKLLWNKCVFVINRLYQVIVFIISLRTSLVSKRAAPWRNNLESGANPEQYLLL